MIDKFAFIDKDKSIGFKCAARSFEDGKESWTWYGFWGWKTFGWQIVFVRRLVSFLMDPTRSDLTEGHTTSSAW